MILWHTTIGNYWLLLAAQNVLKFELSNHKMKSQWKLKPSWRSLYPQILIKLSSVSCAYIKVQLLCVYSKCENSFGLYLMSSFKFIFALILSSFQALLPLLLFFFVIFFFGNIKIVGDRNSSEKTVAKQTTTERGYEEEEKKRHKQCQ